MSRLCKKKCGIKKGRAIKGRLQKCPSEKNGAFKKKRPKGEIKTALQEKNGATSKKKKGEKRANGKYAK